MRYVCDYGYRDEYGIAVTGTFTATVGVPVLLLR